MNQAQESINAIVEKVNFTSTVPFKELLSKCIQISNDTSRSTYAVWDNIVFKVDVFFKGSSTYINLLGKNRQYDAGVEALSTIFEELDIDLDRSECFMLFHLRNLGKFRKKESDLKDELVKLWKEYPEYAMEDREFSRALKNLMRLKLIDYRRGNLYLNTHIIIRFKP